MIRKIKKEDCPAIARMWRDYLDVPTATDESVYSTFEKMSKDNRYMTYVAEEDGIVAGFITLVEVLSFDDPDGYVKMNGIASTISTSRDRAAANKTCGAGCTQKRREFHRRRNKF